MNHKNIHIHLFESSDILSISTLGLLENHFKDQNIVFHPINYITFKTIQLLEKAVNFSILVEYSSEPNQKDFLVVLESFKMVLNSNKKQFFVVKANSQTEAFEQICQVIALYEKSISVGFSISDMIQLHKHGVKIDDISTQLQFFKRGIKKSVVDRPAVVNDGIRVLKPSDVLRLASVFDVQKSTKKLAKFVPASGAASRMFKFLSEFLIRFDLQNDTLNSYINKYNDTSLKIFLAGLDKFPFYEDVRNSLKSNYPDYSQWTKEQKIYYFVKTILESKAYRYLDKPKAVLPFHSYENFHATPIQEHLNEAVLYATSNGKANVHFTISENHQAFFEEILEQRKADIEATNGIIIDVTFSCQQKATDTIAVDLQNNPFRTDEGTLLLRPGGHGALIKNLNDLDSDIVFVKNIDNVVNGTSEVLVTYKKALAGVLVEVQEKVFTYLRLMLSEEKINKNQIKEITLFAVNELSIALHPQFKDFKKSSKLKYLIKILNRPIRVCGMVKNEGEPGGGPFWIVGENGKVSLQIVESSQIDTSDAYQVELIAGATHFNPVDLVCAYKDYQGNKFDLNKFVDEKSGFIVQKNKLGKDVKSYELPGLWNGAMADWISIFVEVPLETFNPVKTVNDLLKPAHQLEN